MYEDSATYTKGSPASENKYVNMVVNSCNHENSGGRLINLEAVSRPAL